MKLTINKNYLGTVSCEPVGIPPMIFFNTLMCACACVRVDKFLHGYIHIFKKLLNSMNLLHDIIFELMFWYVILFHFIGHPRFLNQLSSGLDIIGLAGEWLIATVNTNMYVFSIKYLQPLHK